MGLDWLVFEDSYGGDIWYLRAKIVVDKKMGEIKLEEEGRYEAEQQEEAALRLQGRVRIRSAKKQVGERKKKLEEERLYEAEQQEKAAVRLQGRVRIKSAKKKVNEKRKTQ